MSVSLETVLEKPDVGSPDDHAYYCRKEEIARAAVEGGLVQALCGVMFMPLRDPENYPVCQRCAELLEQFQNRGLS
jgi:hypothetical protein